MNKSYIITILLLTLSIVSWADESDQDKEPIINFMEFSLQDLLEVDIISLNVLGAHTHYEDEWMIGYKYMFMNMDENRDGTSRVSNKKVLEDFPVTPTNMTMEMHMFMLMYAPSNDLTLVGMLPYIRKSMDHITRMDVKFNTTTEGIGDTNLSGLYTFYRKDETRHRLLLEIGLNIPTGSIDEKGDTPAGKNQKLPYPMQLGSGTIDPIVGLLYLGESEFWAWGGEAVATLRLYENKSDYKLGNNYHFNGWGSRKLTDTVSTTIGLDANIWKNISGADPDLNPNVVPTADPNRRAGTRIDGFVGVNFYVSEGRFKDNRFAVQGGIPVYQDLDGPQLETDWWVSGGWIWTF